MPSIFPVEISQAVHHRVETESVKTRAESEEVIRGSRGTRRKFIAEAASYSTVASDAEVMKDLIALNNGTPGAWKQLMSDIGGPQNLSTYRTKDGLWSLLALCGRISDKKTVTLTNAATLLLDQGFQYSANGQNDLPPRYQWGWDPNTQEEENGGYCGETSMVTAALDNGEYMSQYDARAIGTGQAQNDSQLLIGDGSDETLAKAMHLQYSEFQGKTQAEFIQWLTDQVNSGHPVAIGVYTNVNMFGEKPPGDAEYDHIVVVTGIHDGKITFCDNGLYGGNTPTSSQYLYTMPLSSCFGTRAEANQSSSPYTIPLFNNDPKYANHGIAIEGVQGSSETLPVHLLTNVNNEPKEIKDGSNKRPPATPVALTGCITGLTPGKTYKIYVYKNDQFKDIPDSDFNKNGAKATECITFTATGSSYVFTNQIQSSDKIAFRVVPSDGP